MKILFVSPYIPSLVRTRSYNLIRGLLRLGHSITLFAVTGDSPSEQEQANELKSWGIRVDVFPTSLWRSLNNCLRALPTREPLQAVYSYQPKMEQRLVQLLQEESFDVVHIEHLRSARLVRAVSGTPAVYDSVDCISLLFEQAAKIGSQLRSRLMTVLDLARTRRYEARLLTQYDQVIITSQRDKQALQALARRYLPPQIQPAPITIITNGVDIEYFRSPDTPRQRDTQTVIFSGKMSYHANVSGVLHFAQETLPHIWAKNPDVRFQIVGKDPPEAIRQLAADNRIQVTGYVDDLRPYLAQATVAVCSVPYAVGVQFKVLEAMAMGTPVVCSQASFSGLQAQEEKDVLVAKDSRSFADHVLRVISDKTLRESLAVAGRRYVEAYHSWDAGARRLADVYTQARANSAIKTRNLDSR